ncbi:MAG TPA: ATP-binding protein [Urbifossiella sp.]|jgi:PAS domain S-box-containing protein|nr:ATP-binding protein [Urbifossiella sp.]
MSEPSRDEVFAEVRDLRTRLAEAQDTLRAIQGGEVDAVVVTAAEPPRVLTLDSADKPYRLLVEQMRQGAATLTVAGAILSCNDRFARLVRTPPDRLPGLDFRALVDPPYAPILDALLADGLAAAVDGEVVLRRGDGTTVPVVLGVSALREGPAGVCLIVADISDQKRRERLVADEALARSILEQVADAVVVCDPAGTVVRASRAARDLCGANPLMRPFADSFPLAVLRFEGGGPADLGPAFRGDAVRGLEVGFSRPTGERAELLLSAGPLVAAGGDLLGVVATLTDITPLRRAEDELRRRAAELETADRRKDEFLAMLAHELRNPLAPIRSSLEILRLTGIDDPVARKSRDVIDRQVGQLTRLVDDLLEVARISSGKIQLRLERVDVAAAVTQAVETARPGVDAKGHHLSVTLPPAPLWVEADPTRLAQVIGNLLNNAAKYTEGGGRIWVTAAREGAEAVVRVRDTGVGIPPDMLGTVFDLFTQADRSIDRAQGGLGIGLALVKRLVAMHGGRVAAASGGPGQGSEFVVRLPAAEAAAPGPAGGRAGPDAGPPPAAHAGRRVLIVDDNADAAESLAALLGLQGHAVRTAADGPTALGAAAEFRPDLVLCDLGLPGMDGYEVVRQLRAVPALAQTRFIALTGYGREADIDRTRSAGFHAHLVKPFDPTRLADVLGHVG